MNEDEEQDDGMVEAETEDTAGQRPGAPEEGGPTAQEEEAAQVGYGRRQGPVGITHRWWTVRRPPGRRRRHD